MRILFAGLIFVALSRIKAIDVILLLQTKWTKFHVLSSWFLYSRMVLRLGQILGPKKKIMRPTSGVKDRYSTPVPLFRGGCMLYDRIGTSPEYSLLSQP
jgi:hypothetical protein